MERATAIGAIDSVVCASELQYRASRSLGGVKLICKDRGCRSSIMLLACMLALGALVPNKYTPLPMGAVTPEGWLLDQLTIQAEGLSGHLAQ